MLYAVALIILIARGCSCSVMAAAAVAQKNGREEVEGRAIVGLGMPASQSTPSPVTTTIVTSQETRVVVLSDGQMCLLECVAEAQGVLQIPACTPETMYEDTCWCNSEFYLYVLQCVESSDRCQGVVPDEILAEAINNGAETRPDVCLDDTVRPELLPHTSSGLAPTQIGLITTSIILFLLALALGLYAWYLRRQRRKYIYLAPTPFPKTPSNDDQGRLLSGDDAAQYHGQGQGEDTDSVGEDDHLLHHPPQRLSVTQVTSGASFLNHQIGREEVVVVPYTKGALEAQDIVAAIAQQSQSQGQARVQSGVQRISTHSMVNVNYLTTTTTAASDIRVGAAGAATSGCGSGVLRMNTKARRRQASLLRELARVEEELRSIGSGPGVNTGIGTSTGGDAVQSVVEQVDERQEDQVQAYQRSSVLSGTGTGISGGGNQIEGGGRDSAVEGGSARQSVGQDTVSGTDAGGDGEDASKEQIGQLRTEIERLNRMLESAWALGNSDVPPPGYNAAWDRPCA